MHQLAELCYNGETCGILYKNKQLYELDWLKASLLLASVDAYLVRLVTLG